MVESRHMNTDRIMTTKEPAAYIRPNEKTVIKILLEFEREEI